MRESEVSWGAVWESFVVSFLTSAFDQVDRPNWISAYVPLTTDTYDSGRTVWQGEILLLTA